MVSLRFSRPSACSLDESHWTIGNFHALLLFRNDEELAIVREAVHRMVERAIKMEGTCKLRILYDYPTRWFQVSTAHDLFPHYTGTGEHGVGIGKRKYLYSELGEGTVELMRSIKKTIDPLGLFNPGKVSVQQRVTELRSGFDSTDYSYTRTRA